MQNDTQQQLLHSEGERYWRSLDQLADTPEYREFLHREFPEGASEMDDKLTRRKFFSLMGASMALAGVTGCRRPVEKIVPYVTPPEDAVTDIAKYYATTMPFGLDAYGLLVKSHEGRPIKIEGNPLHPATSGSANSQIQAELLNLYDPDRSQHITQRGEQRTISDFTTAWSNIWVQYLSTGGEGLAVLSETFNSPTMARLKRDFKATFPNAHWVSWDPVSDENLLRGLRDVAKLHSQPVYHFEHADVVLSLDADFLLTETGNIANTRDFTQRRHVESERDSMNRLYAVETGYSLTGSMADHRLRLQHRHVGAFAVELGKALTKKGLRIDSTLDIAVSSGWNIPEQWLDAVADDLLRTRGKSLVIAGRKQPPAVHALILAINIALGNIGATIEYLPMPDASPSDTTALANLLDQMQNGAVTTLVMLGGNPVYNAPTDFNFSEGLDKVEHTIHLSAYFDETSRLSEWHIPRSHFLESWKDARSIAGIPSITQPLIAPLFDSYTENSLLFCIMSGAPGNDHDLVRTTWKPLLADADFETAWRKTLHDGLLQGEGLQSAEPVVDVRALTANLRACKLEATPTDNELELLFEPSPTIYDGRYANNGWLQELPHPISKIVWDNAAMISAATADRLGLTSKDVIAISAQNRRLEIPVVIQPGQAENSLTVSLGYGRQNVGRVADAVGVNTYALRTSQTLDVVTDISVERTGATAEVVTSQDHHSMEERPIIREATLEEYKANPDFAPEMVKHPPLESLWEEPDYSDGNQWGMAIDLNSCTGCGACTTACQSENNIPVVGKEQVDRGREMHWIRLDRYYAGDTDEPEMSHQPVMCQHCELAPCEQVCPVSATVHSEEGLNQMVYNRCIGTRYCSNNCPYKVRRFNFFNFTNDTPDLVKMAQNPDVTVRSRGVMEKCTFCVQRINNAKINAKLENRNVADGDVTTACQQSCPANAITFGNINDPNSKVSKVKQQNRNYALLAELNLKPRNTYLARIKNVNPALEQV
jgi:MoCo/4Fe-4S cofactor protein with predicted Tat translocation signal